ncbi:substrate-binding periplasmic protein [Methylobacterium organophilum]|uniref:Solute-binding protein family 3/N-terminal domain-containing protein n=1 Tax=Methylobacterium organophilum TaxID=410 RepID=A0ABQ4T2R2_METOR|nr:transporter substrate-binding domain-containing protein [Methylobacterium organophilum]GJE25813.1 hypothetical protein LKMONMHP_0656 [Methylobacterium organophilum]
MTRKARRLALACALVLGLAAPAAARPYDEVVAAGEIIVALYGDNAPFSEMKDGKPVGIDVDLAQAIADRLKVKLNLRIVDAGENVDGDFRLNLWKGDLAGSPLADLMLHVPNDKQLALRNEQVFMTTPYFDQHLAFAWKKDKLEGLESLKDFEGKKVALEGNSASDAQLLMAGGGNLRENLLHFRSTEAAAQAYLAGEAPILAGSRAAIEAALFAAKAPRDENPVVEIAIPGMMRAKWDLGGAVRANSRDLGYAVGDTVTALIADGTVKTICDRYGVTYTAPQGF